jgi:histidinol-phosphate aminotransferase
MLLRGFGNHRVVGLDPSFPVTKMQAGVHGLSFTPWPLDQNFAFDLAALPRLDPGSLVIFASPNNPTGSVLPAKDIEKLVQEHPQCLFVADEAYAEFHEDHLLSLVEKHPNLVSMRTMSKAWASAGVRFGYLLGDPAIIAELKKFRLPYAINAFCSSAVRYYLGNKALQLWSKQKVQEVKSLTQSFLSEVSTIGREAGWRVYPTAANFFLVSFESTEHIPALYDYLKEHGTLVRNVSKAKGLEKCLRFSCGTPEQVTRTVALLKTFVSELSR